MKGAVGILLLACMLFGGLAFYQHQQFQQLNTQMMNHVTATHDWSKEVSAKFAEITDWSHKSQTILEQNITGRLSKIDEGLIKAIALTNANAEELASQKKAAEQQLDTTKEAAKDAEEFKPGSEESDEEKEDRERDAKDLEEINTYDPFEIAKNPQSAIDKAKEIEERYRRHQLEALNLEHEIKNLDREISELETIEPQTEDIKKKIEQKKAERKEKVKKKEEIEKKMRRERMMLRILQALLQIGAMIAMGTGNPTAAMALMAASTAVGQIAAEEYGEEKEGSGGGYPPQPPPPPPMGSGSGNGRGEGQVNDKKKNESDGKEKQVPNDTVGDKEIAVDSNKPVPSEANIVPSESGGKIWLRYWKPAPHKLELSDDDKASWREWIVLSPEALAKILDRGQASMVFEADKKLHFKDKNGKLWAFQKGASPELQELKTDVE